MSEARKDGICQNLINKYYDEIDEKATSHRYIPPLLRDKDNNVIIENITEWANNGGSQYRIVTYPLNNYNSKFKLIAEKFGYKMRECKICGRKFYPRKIGKTPSGFSEICTCCDVIVECSNINCKNINIVDDHVLRVLNNLKNGGVTSCSRECSSQIKLQRQKDKVCPICGDSNFNIMGLCMTCHNKKINSGIMCEKHGWQEKSFAGKCIKCLTEENFESMQERAYLNLEKINNTHLEWCEACGRETLHDEYGNCKACLVKQIFDYKFSSDEIDCNENCDFLKLCEENPKLYKNKNKNYNG